MDKEIIDKRFILEGITNLEGGAVTDKGDHYVDVWALLYNGIVIPFEDGTVKRIYIKHSIYGEKLVIDNGEDE